MLSFPLVLNLPPSLHLNDDQFFQLCAKNHHLIIQRNQKTGELFIMTPTGGETGHRNFSLNGQLYIWTEKDGTGIAFDSSTGFSIIGASREPMSPDAAWLKLENWNALKPQDRAKFPPICPEFIVELRSPSDSLSELQRKMQEWIDLGVKLGWLIDPQNRKVYVYNSDGTKECLDNPTTVKGEPILQDFVLNMAKIW